MTEHRGLPSLSKNAFRWRSCTFRTTSSLAKGSARWSKLPTDRGSAGLRCRRCGSELNATLCTTRWRSTKSCSGDLSAFATKPITTVAVPTDHAVGTARSICPSSPRSVSLIGRAKAGVEAAAEAAAAAARRTTNTRTDARAADVRAIIAGPAAPSPLPTATATATVTTILMMTGGEWSSSHVRISTVRAITRSVTPAASGSTPYRATTM
mmetsp:Transcript_7142/g.20249  ORF Transcript_7142/g.20249 Transcript_7142/m.20249 type:complete len:210 (-) Transcript_7142:1744-2373(-)